MFCPLGSVLGLELGVEGRAQLKDGFPSRGAELTAGLEFPAGIPGSPRGSAGSQQSAAELCCRNAAREGLRTPLSLGLHL